MPIEIDLGERFGKIKIEREKSLRELLTDLKKDKEAINRAIEANRNDRGLVKRAKGMLSDRIQIAFFVEDLAASRLQGYDVVEHVIYACADGSLLDEVSKMPHHHSSFRLEGVGWSNLEDESRPLDPKYLPEIFKQKVDPKELGATINDLFYPER